MLIHKAETGTHALRVRTNGAGCAEMYINADGNDFVIGGVVTISIGTMQFSEILSADVRVHLGGLG